MNMYIKHKYKIKRLNIKLKMIEDKYPHINFRCGEFRRDTENHFKYMKELIHAEVDAKACKSELRMFMCTECNCWKSKLNN